MVLLMLLVQHTLLSCVLNTHLTSAGIIHTDSQCLSIARTDITALLCVHTLHQGLLQGT